MTQEKEKINISDQNILSFIKDKNPEDIELTPELEEFIDMEIERISNLLKEEEKILAEIDREIDKIEEEEKKEMVLQKLEKPKELPPILEKKKSLKSKIAIGVATAVGGGALLSQVFHKEKQIKDFEKKNNKNTENPTITKTEDTTKTKKIDPSPADSAKKEKPSIEPETIKKDKKIFNQEVYNSLPEQGKEIYKFFAENDPTPGYGYQILDKDSAIFLIFDKENKLVAKDTVGFGQHLGDSPNTSGEYNEGNMTTPSGVYMISSIVTKKDIEEYGGLSYSLFGVTVQGEKTTLGIHQTYSGNNELERRTKLLNSPSPDDNNFSNGCININKENFAKHIKPYFKGTLRELLFILPDKASKQSGNKFDLKFLLKKIMPIILESATWGNALIDGEVVKINKKEKLAKMYSENKEIVDSLYVEIENMTKEQGRMVDEWRKNKSKEKENKIAKINKGIKDKKEELFKARKFMNFGKRGLKDIEMLEKKTAEIMAM